MRKRNTLIFGSLLLICLSLASFAQVPGYQGKRFSISLDLNGSIAISNPTYVSNLYAANYPDNHINSLWIANADYIITRSSSLGITLQHLRTGVDTYLPVNISGYVEDASVFADLNTTGMGAYYKTFFFQRSGAIAPLGYYNQFSAIVYLTSVQSIFTESFLPSPSSVTNYGHVATNLALTYTVGEQWVYFNHLIMDLGVEIGIIPSYIPHIAQGVEDDSEVPPNETNPQIIADAVRSRLSGHFLINMHVGLGYLIF